MAEAKEVSKTSQELSLVFPSDTVYFNPGDDVILSCHLEPAISAASMEIKWRNKSDLVCHYKDGQVTVSREYEGRVSLSLEDLHNGNVSLTLRDVRSSQRGCYICEVIHECQTIQDTVVLHISCRPARRLRSREGIPPLMARHDDGQNRIQTSEGNTDTQQELIQPEAGESIIVAVRARTHGGENPGTAVQSIATEQERSSPAVQSQVQEREAPQVSSLAGKSTQTSERPEDRR